ncbi:MAG: DUF99 family protein [Anaerolineae bacterium]|nr:DUF99 family protein [Anaerolineales bacterium]MCQ3971831.1 DUF99 domain-containing protein [Anaerolineae bacterium]
MSVKRYSNIIGFDDAPFTPATVGPVQVVGTVYTGLYLTGVVMGEVTKDGSDAAEKLAHLVTASRFAEHIQMVMLQGIALGGFNVVDVADLHDRLGMPVLVVSRKLPDLAAVRNALLTRVPEGEQKWALIERLGPLEAAGRVYIQRAGLTFVEAEAVIQRFTVHGHIPEPLRVAHLIAGALVNGQSRGRA